MPVVNQAAYESTYTGVAGETFTRSSSRINGSTVVWNPTFTDLTGGWYEWTYTPTIVGDYVWNGTSSSGTPVTINFEATATDVSITISAATSGALAITRSDLRRRVAERFEDIVPIIATSNGTTTTFIDAFNVSTATEHYNGRVIYFTSGTNASLQARITGTSGSTLTFTPARSATATDDTAEVYNRRGLGFTPDQYHNAINNAINDAYPIGTLAVTATISGTFSVDTPEITIPASITQIDTLESQLSNGDWRVVPPSRQRGGEGWYVDKGLGQLRLHGNAARQADTLALRIHGRGRQSTLTADSDTCSLNTEYIVSRAAYHLAFGAIHKHDSFGQMVTIFQQESERLRTRLRTLRDPLTKGGRN